MGTSRRSTMITAFAPLFLLATLGLTGCAADSDDDVDDEMGESADEQRKNAAYERVLRAPKIETTATPGNATASATTTLLGFLPNESVEDALTQLLGVNRWTEIRDSEGKKVFEKAQLVHDDSRRSVRVMKTKVTFKGGIDLGAQISVTSNADGSKHVSITNTSGYRHWLAGQVLDTGRLNIDLKLIPYAGGTIVDGKAKVKLNTQEQEAPAITAYVGPIFTWLKAR